MQFFKDKFKKVNLNQKVSEGTSSILASAGKKVKETTTVVVSGVKEGLSSSKESITRTFGDKKAEYLQSHPSDCADFLMELEPRVFYMPFPEESLIDKYAGLLNKEHAEHYKIWNISEYAYAASRFNDQVSEYVHVGYPNPPLTDLYLVCKEIASWLQSEANNIAIIHCQKSSLRCCLQLGCYNYLGGQTAHPSEKMEEVAMRLRVSADERNHLLNLTYSKYFHLLFSSYPIRSTKLLIKSVTINHIPKILMYEEHLKDPVLSLFDGHPKPYLQIFKDKHIAYSSTDNIKEFPLKSPGEALEFPVNVLLEGDSLFRVRHFVTSEIRYPVFRFMLNSCFLQEGENIVAKDSVDFGKNVVPSADFFVTVMVERSDEHSDYSDILQKIRLKEKLAKKPTELGLLKLKNLRSEEVEGNPSEESPAFIIGDSPYSKSKSPHEAPKKEHTPNSESKRKKHFFQETPSPTAGELKALSEEDVEEYEEEDEVEDIDEYIKKLESKANNCN